MENLSVLEDCEKWIALYWTLPVPWARDKDRPEGHINLSEDADRAAQESKTIQYQQNLVRHRVKEAKRQLIGEVPFIDGDAFRPTEKIVAILDQIAARCREEGAGFVYVRFGGPFRVRYHAELEHWVKSRVKQADIRCVSIDVSEAAGGGRLAEWAEDEQDTYNPKQVTPGLIDPFAHFRAWKAADQARKYDREHRSKKIIALVVEYQSYGQTFAQIAAYLNSQELYTMTGKPWTTEGLRKFVKRTEEK
jgi:hypothetical protein